MKIKDAILIIALIVVLLTACASSQPRLIPAPSLETVITAPPISTQSPPNLPTQAEAPDAPIDSTEQPDQPSEIMEPWQPQPGDELLDRGNVYLEKAQILVLESYPPQFKLALEGSLPSPCHQLRVKVNPPDPNRKILVEVYSVVNPGDICITVLEPFQVSIPITNPETGRYAILVNGEKAGEIDIP